MNPRRREDVLIAYFPKATDESQWPFPMLSPPLLVIFAKSPADGKPGIDKTGNRYYTTNMNLLGHYSAFLGVMPHKKHEQRHCVRKGGYPSGAGA